MLKNVVYTEKYSIYKEKEPSDVLFLLALPSPLQCLTSLFGMGRGVSTVS